MIRIIHLSDPHFAEITYTPAQFFSKRWLGNCNLILFRKKIMQTQKLEILPELFTSLNVNFVCITGDLTTTSLPIEFEKALRFITTLKKDKVKVFALPGNHDFYTKDSEKNKLFYRYFKTESGPFFLQNDRLELVYLGSKWWWLGLDTALATSLILSNGLFFKDMEKTLIAALNSVPSTDHIIIGNHFPLFKTGKPRHDLWRAEKLQNILKEFPNVKLYLHGHDHVPYIINQPHVSPVVFNAGSCSHINGTFNMFDLYEDQFVYSSFCWDGKWKQSETKTFLFQESFERPLARF